MSKSDWKPQASLATLKKRARLLQKIRDFFKARQVLEVETPLLGAAPVADPHLSSFSVVSKDTSSFRYLQTSPEYAMKRLLAAGSGDIFQLGKAFRHEEMGRYHHGEFTLLEWYRLGFDHHQLMDEMDVFLQAMLGTKPALRFTYAELCEKFLGLNPHVASKQALTNCFLHLNVVPMQGMADSYEEGLEFLFTEKVEPALAAFSEPVFIYDYPKAFAALAKINQQTQCAERFEVYYQGVELANGFHELTDAKEQRARFEENQQQRRRLGLSAVPLDEDLLAALEHGLPACAGVALGVDRLLMLMLSLPHIHEVMAFAVK